MRTLLFLLSFFAFSLTALLGQTDEELQTAVQKAVHAYSLVEIQGSARSGIVTLTGSVNLCRDRLLAVDTVAGIHGVKAIDDRIVVAGPGVPDTQLKPQIDRIIADRIRKLGGFGFGSINANVKGGIVTLSGSAAPELIIPAVNSIAGVIGVKNVTDHVHRVPHTIWRGPDSTGAFPGAGP
jgi:hyperosmotically inducible periplasmic protein